LTNYAKSNF